MKNFHLLEQFIPDAAVQRVNSLLQRHPVNIRITGRRSSKYGDFRPLPDQHFHAITINHDLNPYSFLITFLHELAHLLTWQNHQNGVSPHGKEWKMHFKVLMHPFIEEQIFPDDVKHALMHYMSDPAASSCSSPGLIKSLRNHDKRKKGILLDELAAGSTFKMVDNKNYLFRKGEKARKRYKCLDLNSGREYWVSGLAEVIPIQETLGI
ncbi:MAG: SprT-like domain-containing protein [Bacteroidota bacterium]|nr:SprT-like domain-containing protein [Bacteroidota bacterium]